MTSENDVIARTTCRSCNSTSLIDVLSLGEQYISNFVDEVSDDTQSAPLDLVLCDPANGGCSLLQLRHTVSPEFLYRHYWYRSVINRTMELALRDITDSAEAIVNLESDDVVLDIGCNDGTLLRGYATTGVRLVGFEPARNLVPYASVGTTQIINEFFNARSFHAAFSGDRAKVVTTIAMFYDLDDPNQFVADIRECLAEDGIWINQMAYLPAMLERLMFDNICHEHLEYYSLASLEHLLSRHGLEVFDVTENDVNGGSFRIYIRHRGASVGTDRFGMARVSAMRDFEKHLGLSDVDTYESFAKGVQSVRSQLRAFITSEVQRGKKVYAYGASTKGNTLLQYCELDDALIAAAAERNPDKWGKRTVGTMIPIVSEEEARAAAPDYFLVLPWHFLRDFIEREEEFLQRGGQFIVPLPHPKLVGASGFKLLDSTAPVTATR